MSPLPDDVGDGGDDDDDEEEEIHFPETKNNSGERDGNSYRITPSVRRYCVMRNCCPGEW